MPPPTLPRLDIQNHANLDWLLANGQQPPATFDFSVLSLKQVSPSEERYRLGPLPEKLVPAFVFYRLGFLQAQRELQASPNDPKAKEDQKKIEALRVELWRQIRRSLAIKNDPNKPDLKVSVHECFIVLATPVRDY
jgi:hypothetical protein